MRAPWFLLLLPLLRCASPATPPADAAMDATPDLAAEAAVDRATPAELPAPDVSPACAVRCVNGRMCVAGRCEDAWRAIPAAGAPSPRSRHRIVWTGTEALVWGGFADPGLLRDGGRYNPTTARWRPLAGDGAPGERMSPVALWTGAEMFVWGGRERTGVLGDGARYDPRADAWRPVSADGAPEVRSHGRAVWTGREVFVWGGFDARGNERNTGALYDPATDRWRPLPTRGAPSERAFFTATAVASGQVIVWGGSSSDRSTVPAQIIRTETGVVFDPDLFAWREVDTLGAPARRNDHAAVWTGTELLVWGGAGTLARLATGGLLQP